MKKSKTRKQTLENGKRTRKDKWRSELSEIYVHGGYNPAWFWLEYGKKRGQKIYSRKQKAQDKRLKFLKARVSIFGDR